MFMNRACVKEQSGEYIHVFECVCARTGGWRQGRVKPGKTYWYTPFPFQYDFLTKFSHLKIVLNIGFEILFKLNFAF